MTGINWTELVVFAALFLIVAAMGFVAANWRRPTTMQHLDEWGLGGRSFGFLWYLPRYFPPVLSGNKDSGSDQTVRGARSVADQNSDQNGRGRNGGPLSCFQGVVCCESL